MQQRERVGTHELSGAPEGAVARQCAIGACPLQRLTAWLWAWLEPLFARKGRTKMYQEIFPEEVSAWRSRGARLIDVREAWEFARGHIPGTENLPMSALAELSPNGQPIVLICASGNRSGYAAQLLMQQGFTEVSNLLGGVAGWAGQGRELAHSQQR